MSLRTFLLMSISFFPASSFAVFCPTNFTTIEMGSSLDQVKQQCGAPVKIDVKEVKATGPQEWNYYVRQTVSTAAMNPLQGTIKAQITFDETGKVINISVNGIGVGSTSMCGGAVRLGDSTNSVKALCGDPVLANRQVDQPGSPAAEQPPTIYTTYTYNTNPPTVMTFENGVLVSVEESASQ